MGTESFNRFNAREVAIRACADMLIVATPDHVARIVEADKHHSFLNLVTFPCQNDQAIQPQKIAAAQVLVVEVDPDLTQSVDRLIALGRSYPGLPLIAAIANAPVPLVRTLVREGVTDVVSLPFQLEELLEASLSAIAAAKAKSAASAKLAPLVSVVRSTGGCGASSIATHLACSLASRLSANREIAIVDFDLQSGIVADYLGSSGRGSLFELLAADNRLDHDLIKSIAQSVDGNVAVFAAPQDIQPVENIETDQVLRLLSLMRQQYAGVVLDLPADWTNWALSAVSASDLVILVVELSVNSLRQAKRRLQLFASVGIEPDKVVLLINRVEHKMFKSIDLSDVAATLNREVIGKLSLEEPQLSSAQAQGLLIHNVNRKSKFNHDLIMLADELVTRLRFVVD